MPEIHEMPTLLPSFWARSKALSHVRDGALAALTSPDAVLHSILARIAAFTNTELLVPGFVGGPTPLNYFAAVVAPSGGGKSTAAKAAARLLPAPDHLHGRDSLQIGTGEGLIESFLEKDPDTGEKVQVHRNLFLYVDEGEILKRYARRDGTTLDQTIRTAHSGGALGQTNASKSTSRLIEANAYRLGLVIGFQPGKAGAMLTPDAIDGGTPQRFIWAAAQINPGLAHHVVQHGRPEWPGTLKLPRAWDRTGLLTYPPSVVKGVTSEHFALLTGQAAPPHPLDAHRGLIQLRAAALLSLLDGSNTVTLAHFESAVMLWETSSALRRWVLAQVEQAEDAEFNRQVRRDMARTTATQIARRRADSVEDKIKANVLNVLEASPNRKVTWGVLLAKTTHANHPLLHGVVEDMAAAKQVYVGRSPRGRVELSLPRRDDEAWTFDAREDD